jgi:colicin import membrane protein
MTTIPGHNPFAPPPTPGCVRSLGLALLAHSALVFMVAIGVQWRRELPPVTVEAELWAAVPELAAPLADVAPPQPPQPTLPPVVHPNAPPPVRTADADIAVTKEKAHIQKEKEKEREKEERVADVKAAELAKKKAALKAQEDAEKQEIERRKNIDRMAALAGSGPEGSPGSATQSKGPSPGYAGRIQARVKPNITYTETIVGNPVAEVEVRTAADGTILSSKIIKSSGVTSWDDAVLRAIEKTEVLPRDLDGRVPSPMIIALKPVG